jgi:hypothetical protein
MDRDDSRTDADDATRRYLQQVLLPFWFVPGLLDWRLHKRRASRRHRVPESH